MRARNLKPGYFTNEQLAECSFAARILFTGLWCIADREGRLEDRPRKIKALVFPYDNVDAEPLLCELAAVDLIVRYEVDGSRYIEIPTFTKHQNPHPREQSSNIPSSREKVLPSREKVLPSREKVLPSQEKALPSRAESLNPESLNPESCKDTLSSVLAAEDAADAAESATQSADFRLESAENAKITPSHTAKKTSREKTKTPPGAITPQEITELWNKTVEGTRLPKVLRLNKTRKAHVEARQRDFASDGAYYADFWARLFGVIRGSPFLCGERGNWKADFDFVTERESNMDKILEGRYSDSEPQRRNGVERPTGAGGTIGKLTPEEEAEQLELQRRFCGSQGG